MIKLADIGGLIWVLIIVMITVAKGWSKLQESKENASPEPDDEAQPPVRPRPPISRSQSRPASVPAPRVPRPVPPVMRRPAPQSATGPPPSARKVSADDIRRVVEQMGRKSEAMVPLPPPPRPESAAPPVARAEPPPLPPPLPAPAEAPAPKQTIADAPAPARSSPASQWTEALRDRQNIRNIIIAYEIIGRPRAESL